MFADYFVDREWIRELEKDTAFATAFGQTFEAAEHPAPCAVGFDDCLVVACFLGTKEFCEIKWHQAIGRGRRIAAGSFLIASRTSPFSMS